MLPNNLLYLTVVAVCFSCHPSWAADLKEEFADPALKYAPRPLWFWNNTTVTKEGVASQMKDARDRCGYTDCPHYNAHQPYSDGGCASRLCEYLRLYRGVKGRARRVQCVEVEDDCETA